MHRHKGAITHLRTTTHNHYSPILYSFPITLGPAQARSYKGEIIQFQMAGLNHDTLDLGLNLAFNLRDLGYDHWVVHGGRDNVTCVALLEAMPDAGGLTHMRVVF